jgi:NitT/TauT family transport system substrate-binding protein
MSVILKKILISILCLALIVSTLLIGCNKQQSANEELIPVTLNEVAHSIFYAPQYVAIEKGYFADEGIKLTLDTGYGADKVMAALISGDADIGFMGAEASIYCYVEGNDDYAVNFAQLTQRAGNFLVAREPIENFKWEDLKGATVLGGRSGGMPEMVFEYILKQQGIDPSKDLTIDQSIDFGLTAAAFIEGKGDYTVEFEPYATSLEQEGSGYVVASLGTDSGYVPYTAYSAKKSFLEKNPDTIQKFTNAMQKGMEYVNSHTAKEIAEVIAPQFSETDTDTIATIVDRYLQQNTWKTNLVFEKDGFELLEEILMEAGELDATVPYEDLVNTTYANEAK